MVFLFQAVQEVHVAFGEVRAFFGFHFVDGGVDLIFDVVREAAVGQGIDDVIFFFYVLLQAVGIGHGFRQDLEFIFGLRFLSVEFEGFVEGADVGADEVVFDKHAVFDDDRCDFFKMVDHFREENEFFPAMMMAIGITADEIQALLDYGCSEEEIEEMLYDPELFHEMTGELLYAY